METVMKKIWCLFSIENNYDQPRNNMVCWWDRKPLLHILLRLMVQEDSSTLLTQAEEIHSGKQVRINNYDYRLRQVEEGKLHRETEEA